MKKGNRYLRRYLTYLFALMLILLSASTYGGKKAIPWLHLLLLDEELEKTQEVGPEGGTFKFPNGVILDIPAGAVTQKTSITLDYLPCGTVDAILAAQENAFHKKRCVSGFTAKPDLVFNVPIKAILPILPLEPNEIPLLTEIDFNEQKYWITKTDLTVLADQQVAEIVIPHFSDVVVGAIDGIDPKKLEELCTDPVYNRILQICEDFDDLQPAACLLKKEQRPKGTICCKEGSFTAKAEAIDFSLSKSTGECEILLDNVEVTYHECTLPDGSSVSPQTHTMGEISPNCPKGMTFEIDVQPSPLNMFVCNEKKLTATITGKTADGTALFEDVEFPPIWEDLTPNVVDISPDGTVKGISEGNTQVKALASVDSQIPPGEAVVYVESNILSFSVTPVSLKVDEVKPLQVVILDRNNNPLDASDVKWSWSDPSQTVAELQTQPGLQASVKGKSRGTAEITATYRYLTSTGDDCEEKKATADITVECRQVRLTVDPPSPVSIALYDGRILSAKVVDIQTDNDLDVSDVTWSSSDPDTAFVTNDTGSWTSVQAMKPGTVEITATYNDGCQSKQETVQITVELKVSINPNALTIFVGEGPSILKVQFTDNNGNPIAGGCPSSIDWTFPATDTISFNLATATTASVTGVAPGTVTITATCEGVSGQSIITVIDLNGVWSGTTVADERDCDEGINTYTGSVTISHVGSSIMAKWSSGSFSGTKTDFTISVSGGEDEDGGYSYGSGTLTISPNGRTIFGTIPWDWSGIDPETGELDWCSGTSDITLQR